MQGARKRKPKSLLNSFLNANKSTLREASSLISEISQVGTQVDTKVDNEVDIQVDNQVDHKVGHQIDTKVDKQHDHVLSIKVGKQVDTPTNIPTKRSTSLPSDTPSSIPSSRPTSVPSTLSSSVPTLVPSTKEQNPHQKSPSKSDTQIPYLTEKQLTLYLCIKKLNGKPTNLTKIARATNISENTLKKCLKKLRDTGLIHYFGFCKFGKLSGFKATVTDKKFYFSDTSSDLVRHIDRLDSRILCLTEDLAEYLAHDRAIDLADDMASYRPNDRPIDLASTRHSSSSYINELLQLDLKSLYPNLAAAGFDVSHLKQIIENWAIQKIDLSLLPDSLEKADWTLANDKGKIENKLHYILSPLKRGPFATPNGFKSRKVRAIEEAARRAAEEAKKIRQLEEQRFEDEFLIWWTGLSKEEKEKIDSENKLLPKEGKLRTEFRKEWFRKNAFKPLV